MKEADDDEPTRWTSVGWQALLILNRLRNHAQLTEVDKQQNERREGDTDAGNGDKQKREQHKNYVQHRLCDLRTFEDRYKRLRKK